MADNAQSERKLSDLVEAKPAGVSLTDSPWFWAALFAAMALVALVAMSDKYGRRQANIEQKFQARERVRWEEVGNGQQAERSQEYSQPDDTVIPLWPLAVPLAAVLVLSVVMLVRNQRLNRKGTARPLAATKQFYRREQR